MARTIAVALPKGGVGKTTTAVNLAASLAAEGCRTLLIDMDPIGSSGVSLGFTSSTVTAGIYDVFNFVTAFPKAVHHTELSTLDFVPCNVRTIQHEERIVRLAENRTLLRNLLRPISPQYQYIILDCPPVLRGLCTTALAASDSVLIPVRAGHYGLDAVDKLFSYLDWMKEVTGRTVAVEGILLTMHEPHTKVTDITIRELTAKYRGHLLRTMIPRNTVLSEASFFGKPVMMYHDRCSGSEAYRTLARELIMRHSAAAQPSPLRPTLMERFGTEG
jgi:chromosome partitioning protein